MISEKKTNLISNLVDKIKGSKSAPVMSDDLATEVQKQYGKYVNVLAFISKIAESSVLLAKKNDESDTAVSEKCKHCDHLHVDHERYQTDSFIHFHGPVQKQQWCDVCFRAALSSPCWDCSECYEDNQLSADDDVEHEAMPKCGWVWRDTKTINGTTGHLVYQVPDSKTPIRTRDGYAIPWHRNYCQDHLPKNPAVDLKRANRAAIKDLIEQSYAEAKALADTCKEVIESSGTKDFKVELENRNYYGFILDTTELSTVYDVAILTLFDMAIIETMKVHPEISLEKFSDQVRRRIRIWSYDHFHACNGAIGNALRNIEAQEFIKRRINDDKSVTLLSDFDNKRWTTGELMPESDTSRSFRALERAELDVTSSLQRLQAALNDTSSGTTTEILRSTYNNFQPAARITMPL